MYNSDPTINLNMPIVPAPLPKIPPVSEFSNASTSFTNCTGNVVVEKHVWTKEEGEMLLDLYDANRDQFKNPGVRKIGVWADIAKTINIKFGSEFSAEQCHQKLRNFKNDFHKVMMLEKKDCRHFERLHRIFLQSAVKPTQSPAALKRKLTQLAGSKPVNTAMPPNQKKRCVSFPNFRPRTILPKPSQNKDKISTFTNCSIEKSSFQSSKSSNTPHFQGLKQYPSSVSYVDQSLTPSSSAIYSVVSLSHHGPAIPIVSQAKSQNTPGKSPSSCASLCDNPIYSGMFKDTPTMINCTKVNSSMQANSKMGRNVTNAPSLEIILDKGDIEKITENGESENEDAGLPVPVYYYSSKNPNNVMTESNEDLLVECALPNNESSNKTVTQKDVPDKNCNRTTLGFIKALFDKKDSNKSRDSRSKDEAKAQVSESNQSCRQGSIEHASKSDISRLIETLDNWRNESIEREEARVFREKERDKRNEEMHRENLKLTSRFVDLFEALLLKINSSTE